MIKLGGGQLFVYYPSLPALLQAVFPDFAWAPARFSESAGKMPNGFWNQDNLLDQLKIAEQKLTIQNVIFPPHLKNSFSPPMIKPEDWYSVTLSDLREMGFPSTLSRTTLAELLSRMYPEHRWEKVYLLRGKQAQQKRLENAVVALFPVQDLPSLN